MNVQQILCRQIWYNMTENNLQNANIKTTMKCFLIAAQNIAYFLSQNRRQHQQCNNVCVCHCHHWCAQNSFRISSKITAFSKRIFAISVASLLPDRSSASNSLTRFINFSSVSFLLFPILFWICERICFFLLLLTCLPILSNVLLADCLSSSLNFFSCCRLFVCNSSCSSGNDSDEDEEEDVDGAASSESEPDDETRGAIISIIISAANDGNNTTCIIIVIYVIWWWKLTKIVLFCFLRIPENIICKMYIYKIFINILFFF